MRSDEAIPIQCCVYTATEIASSLLAVTANEFSYQAAE